MTSRRPAATAMDVARLAGVSQSAVSRAFTPGASISAATRERVAAAARQLGYSPNLIARSLITRRSGMIGVAVGTLSNFLYPGMLEILGDRLQALGYRILMFTAPLDGNADPELEAIMRYQVDAVVLAATTLSSRLADECRAAGVPVILFNRTSRSRDVASVTSTNRQGGREIATLFAAGGHRRPAFMAGVENASTSRERERGFAEGLAAAGLPPPLRAVGQFDYAAACAAMTELLRGRNRPDAVFCASDHMAIAAMDVARGAFSLRVPEDISLAGFDDAPPAAWPAYALTTYAQPIAAMVDGTIELLMERITDPAAALRHITVPGHLVLRGSCRPGAGLAAARLENAS